MWLCGCPFRDNDLPGRYKCKDNHTQTNCGVDHAYLPSVSVLYSLSNIETLSGEKYHPVIKALQVATHLEQRKDVKAKVNVKRKWLSAH